MQWIIGGRQEEQKSHHYFRQIHLVMISPSKQRELATNKFALNDLAVDTRDLQVLISQAQLNSWLLLH